jgi:hypothetical protein
VAEEAEGTEVIEVALAAAFGYGEDVVGVPEGAAGGDGFEAVEAQASDTAGTAGPFEGRVGGDGVDVADGAEAAVAGEDLVAEVAGVGAETPLVDTVAGAEGAAPRGEDLEVAPAAEWEAVRTDGEFGAAGDAAARERAGGEHEGSWKRGVAFRVRLLERWRRC